MKFLLNPNSQDEVCINLNSMYISFTRKEFQCSVSLSMVTSALGLFLEHNTTGLNSIVLQVDNKFDILVQDDGIYLSDTDSELFFLVSKDDYKKVHAILNILITQEG